MNCFLDMRRVYFFISILFVLFFQAKSIAQDTLPKFSVRNVGNNRIIIDWVNNFPDVHQISIQRSIDSFAFKTILSVTDPSAVRNGFADNKAPSGRLFYRLFVVRDKGIYFFSPVKKPVLDTVSEKKALAVNKQSIAAPKDSANLNVKKDTVAAAPPVPKKPEFVPSLYVYTNRDGYVSIRLPDALIKKYNIKFFEDNGSFLFELKEIKDTSLTMDKSNFYHSGWFHFELYENDRLLEKNRFFLARDF